MKMLKGAVVGCLATCALAQVVSADIFEVTLGGGAFNYNGQRNMDVDLRIQPGDTVRWIWVDGFHNVVSGLPGAADGLFHSGDPVGAPMTFEYTFTDPGEFLYHCHVHGGFGMVSSVVVECRADFNGDGTVNTLDFLAFLNAFSAGDASADFNGDGTVNTLDFLAFLNAFSAGC